MPAIVLSCDRYHPFAEHMIMRYGALWPSHPFTFHVPYQRRPLQGKRISPRPAREVIRATVLDLLEGLDDATWIYWCIDDKYPIQFVVPSVEALAEAVLDEQLPGVDGVLFCRCRRHLQPERLRDEKREGPAGIVLLRRRDYSQIWIHQFLRVKVLRELFLRLPRADPLTLDATKDRAVLPLNHRLYVVETNLAVFGESTSAGRITSNCAASFQSLGLGMPPGFEVLDRQIFMGTIDDMGALSSPADADADPPSPS